MSHYHPDLARAAASEFQLRQARAREAVRTGRMDPRTATQHLRPWLAIACLCGADLPELAEGLADMRERQIVWPEVRRHDAASPSALAAARGGYFGGGISPADPQEIGEAEARGRLADEISPRAVWAPLLASARDKALTGPLATPEQRAGAVALRELASHLMFDPNGRNDVPPFDCAAAFALEKAA
ncbi:MAG: hypothetical protein FP826_01505 [Sphingomonadales bacterium]|nr:hypothetical protein [Sphingomonadales bacterium]MBU3993739.1 hypothetical protein [Alphaproteobacteria bacterium]